MSEKTRDKEVLREVEKAFKKTDLTLTPAEKQQFEMARVSEVRSRHINFIVGGPPLEMWYQKCGDKHCEFCKDWKTERRNIWPRKTAS